MIFVIISICVHSFIIFLQPKSCTFRHCQKKTFLLYHTRREFARKIVQNSRKNFFSEKKESVRLYQTEKSRKVERRCSLLATPHKACVVLPFVFIDCLPFPETYHGGSVCPKPPVPTSSPVCHSCSTGQWKCRRGAKTFPTLQCTPAPSA